MVEEASRIRLAKVSLFVALLALAVVVAGAWQDKAWAAEDPATGTITRIKGESTAVETAVESSKAAFPNGSKIAVIAREDDYKDSMSATGMAGALKAPILLTNRTYLSPQTEKELQRLKVEKVYLVGGSVAVSNDVENSLRKLADVERVFGSDACDTSVKCASILEKADGNQRNTLDMAIVATSVDFADALSVSSAAYKYHIPIFITTELNAPDGDRVLREDAKAMISNYGTLFAPGGTGALPATSVENTFGGKCVRVNGLTGYDTAVKVADWMVEKGYLGTETVGVANGTAEAHGTDALTSAPVLAMKNAPLILVEGTPNTKAATAYLADNSDTCNNVVVFGGYAVCPVSLTAELDKAVRGVLHYVAILGSDYWTAPNLAHHLEGSDLMILMRVDVEDSKISLLTVPRDTYYPVHNENYQYEMLGQSCPCGPCSNNKTWYKANYAFHYGYYRNYDGSNHEEATAAGAKSACEAISEVTGVGVTKYALCDMVTYQSIVNAFNEGNGAWINIPLTITYRFYDGYNSNVTLNAGEQYLNGWNAMVYARARTAYMSEFQQYGINEDAERQAGNRNMFRTLVNYALYPQKAGFSSTGDLLNFLVSSGFIITNIPSEDIVSWSAALQAKAEGTRVYGATGPVDGSVKQFPHLGQSGGDAGQYSIDYDAGYYQRLAEQMCTGNPLQGAYSTDSWTISNIK